MFLRPIHVASLLLLVTLVLAGCRTVPFEPPIEASVVAVVFDPTPGSEPLVPVLAAEVLSGGSALYYRIDAPNARALVYAEAVGDDLRVTLYDLRGRVQGVSIDPDRFGRSVARGTDPAIEASGITVNYVCRGPCVAASGSIGSYVVRVENRASNPRSFDLYAYTMDPTDDNEPNDSPGTATVVRDPGTFEGAIERIVDLDYFRYTGSQTRLVTFDAFSDDLGLVLEIEDGPTLRSGQSSSLLPDEVFRVRSERSRAGPSSSSAYVVTLGAVTGPTLNGTVSASSAPARLLDATVPAFSSLWYRVRVPSSLDLLYGEVVGTGSAQPGDLRVRVTRRDGATLAVSESPAYFVDDVSGLSALLSAGAEEMATSAVSPERVCVGPCAAVAPSSDTYYLRVENRSGFARSFDLYAYVIEAADPSDRGVRQNDSAAFAVNLEVGASRFGAIELVGDVDWFRYRGGADGVLTFDEVQGAGALGLRLRFESDGFEMKSGESAVVRPNDRFVVFSREGRAGPAGSSGYFLQIGAP